MEELTPSPSARVAMGQTRRFAERIDLAEMSPHNDLVSTGYCLANPGSEYLVFQPGSRGYFTVNLSDAKGSSWSSGSTSTPTRSCQARPSKEKVAPPSALPFQVRPCST
jgi:hypothetical protein